MPTKRQTARSIVRTLRDHDYEAYFVGGCVRDLVLRRRPSDYDIATSAPPGAVEKLFKKTIPVGKTFGVMIVRLDGRNFEVATFRKDFDYQDGRRPERVEFADARMDVLRRDFTVNGLFMDPASGKILDWVGGVRDARRKLIRTIGSPARRFREDKLRVLRAVRFAANLGFAIEKRTFQAVRKMRRQIRWVSAERIRDELVKIITGPDPARGFQLLDKTGLIEIILPEVAALKGLAQPRKFHPEGDVFRHTRLCFGYLENAGEVLAFSVLLHDIGKKRTFRREEGGRIRFKNHDKIGARLSGDVLTRLRCSNDVKKRVQACIEWHMQFKDAKKMRESTLKRMFQRETFDDELELHRVDCLASHGDLSIWRFLKRRRKTLTRAQIRPEPFLRGRDLISMGCVPGPSMGRMLKEAEEEQLERRLKTKEEALAWAKQNRKRFGL